MKCFFIPGRKPKLSLAELKSVLDSRNIPFILLSSNSEVIIIDIQQKEVELVELFSKLGGFTRFGKVVNDPYKYLESELLNEYPKNQKVNFAVSLIGKSLIQNMSTRDCFKLGMELKKWIKFKGFKARFVSNPQESDTSLVLLEKNKVMTEGFELIMFNHPKNHSKNWGITLGIQDFEQFSDIDYGRPKVNKSKGMLPPKLARMMVNLSGTPENGVIWDPFCGSGTVLMEAMLLGYSVVGSDVDPVAIEESETNLAWLCKKYDLDSSKYKVFQHDITKGYPKDLVYDSIIAEPYLGPTMRSIIGIKQFETVAKDIKDLYSGLEQIVTHSNKGKKIVIVVPGYKTGAGWIDIDPPFINTSAVRDISGALGSKDLQWDRPNSIIRRNIKIFEY